MPHLCPKGHLFFSHSLHRAGRFWRCRVQGAGSGMLSLLPKAVDLSCSVRSQQRLGWELTALRSHVLSQAAFQESIPWGTRKASSSSSSSGAENHLKKVQVVCKGEILKQAELARGRWDGKGSKTLPNFRPSQNVPTGERTVNSSVRGKQNTSSSSCSQLSSSCLLDAIFSTRKTLLLCYIPQQRLHFLA